MGISIHNPQPIALQTPESAHSIHQIRERVSKQLPAGVAFLVEEEGIWCWRIDQNDDTSLSSADHWKCELLHLSENDHKRVTELKSS
jgi:hypothetical protein